MAILLLLFAWTIAPTSASAQNDDTRPLSYTKGLYIDGTVAGSSVSFDGSDGADSGVVFAGRIGYGFTDVFGLFVEFGAGGFGSDQELTVLVHPDDYAGGFFELGAQVNFRPGKQWVPYAEVALNGFATADEAENSLSGGGFTLGGGVKYYITDAWALNGRLQLARHAIETADIDGQQFEDVDEDATTRRFSFGLTWYLLR